MQYRPPREPVVTFPLAHEQLLSWLRLSTGSDNAPLQPPSRRLRQERFFRLMAAAGLVGATANVAKGPKRKLRRFSTLSQSTLGRFGYTIAKAQSGGVYEVPWTFDGGCIDWLSERQK